MRFTLSILLALRVNGGSPDEPRASLQDLSSEGPTHGRDRRLDNITRLDPKTELEDVMIDPTIASGSSPRSHRSSSRGSAAPGSASSEKEDAKPVIINVLPESKPQERNSEQEEGVSCTEVTETCERYGTACSNAWRYIGQKTWEFLKTFKKLGTEDLPNTTRRFINSAFVGSVGLAVFWPIADHHYQGMLNWEHIETISGALATHWVWAASWGTIGAAFGGMNFYDMFKHSQRKSKEDGLDKTNIWFDGSTLAAWTVGSVCQMALLWFPIGTSWSSWHKLFIMPAFGFAGIGMIMFLTRFFMRNGWGSFNKTRNALKSITMLLSIFAIGFFMVKGNSWAKDKVQVKIPQKQCYADNPNNRWLCEGPHLLEPNTELGMCAPDQNGWNMKVKYACSVDEEFNFLDLPEARSKCASLTNEKGTQCKLWNDETTGEPVKLTGWYKPVAQCQSSNKDLRGGKGGNDTCNAASMHNSHGLYDEAKFETNCDATKDAAGNPCEFVNSDDSKAAWKKWSQSEIGAFVGLFVVQAIMVFTWA